MSALNITKNNFHEEVVQSDKPVLLALLGQLVRSMSDGGPHCGRDRR